MAAIRAVFKSCLSPSIVLEYCCRSPHGERELKRTVYHYEGAPPCELAFLLGLLLGESFDEGAGGAEDDGVAAGVLEARQVVKLLDEGAGEGEGEGRLQVISDCKFQILNWGGHQREDGA